MYTFLDIYYSKNDISLIFKVENFTDGADFNIGNSNFRLNILNSESTILTLNTADVTNRDGSVNAFFKPNSSNLQLFIKSDFLNPLKKGFYTLCISEIKGNLTTEFYTSKFELL